MPPAAAPGKQHTSARSPRGAPQPIEYQILLTVTLCLLAVGAVMVYSASSARTLEGRDGTEYLIRYLIYGGIGLLVLRMLAQHGIEALPRVTGGLLVVAFGLLVVTRVAGVEVNGAKRWLGAGPVQFQPSEIMKLALVLYAARLLATRPAAAHRPRELIPLALIAGAACGAIALQPDLGTALVVACTAVAILIAAGLPVRHLGALGAFGGTVVALYAMSEPYRRARLTAFWDPWAHAGTIGYQFVQGQIAIGSGGIFGRGLGESVQKINYLPEAHTDFILAIIGEELGVAGILGLLVLYGMLAYAGLRVAQRAAGRYAKLLAVGLTSMIMCQALLNMFAVLGIAPLTGVPLPFISYGSTNLVILLAGVGLLLNIAATRGIQLRVAETAESARGSRNDRSAPADGSRAGFPGDGDGHDDATPALAGARRLWQDVRERLGSRFAGRPAAGGRTNPANRPRRRPRRAQRVAGRRDERERGRRAREQRSGLAGGREERNRPPGGRDERGRPGRGRRSELPRDQRGRSGRGGERSGDRDDDPRGSRDQPGWPAADQGRDGGGRDRWPRGARAGRGRRAAG
jgi:cell division protein FtsW